MGCTLRYLGHRRTGEEGERGIDLIAPESPTISAMRRNHPRPKRSTDQGRLCARGVSGDPLARGYSRMKA
jgi:hypothetical protein